MAEKMKVLFVCPMADAQSGIYINNSLIEMKNRVAYFDWRLITETHGVKYMNEQLIAAHRDLKPDLTIIIKGLGIEPETIKAIKEFHKNPIVGWIFDVTLGGTFVKDVPKYVEFMKQFDKFYTIDADAVPELELLGVNADWLTEGCFLHEHKETVFNSFQKKKYGSDVVFLGAVGSIHPKREEYLKALHEAGFDFKIYGDVLYEPNTEPEWVKEHHTGFSAINDYHSLVCQASKVVIGIDGWPDRSKAWSARLYRTMCPGGFYLTSHTKDIEQYFTPGEHLDTYKTPEELVEKVSYWLQNTEEREKVAKAGQKLVIDKYQFIPRLQKIIDDVGAKPSIGVEDFIAK